MKIKVNLLISIDLYRFNMYTYKNNSINKCTYTKIKKDKNTNFMTWFFLWLVVLLLMSMYTLLLSMYIINIVKSIIFIKIKNIKYLEWVNFFLVLYRKL